MTALFWLRGHNGSSSLRCGAFITCYDGACWTKEDLYDEIILAVSWDEESCLMARACMLDAYMATACMLDAYIFTACMLGDFMATACLLDAYMATACLLDTFMATACMLDAFMATAC
eukprot:1160607-Pelagomonas_calceolata.AAC.1